MKKLIICTILSLITYTSIAASQTIPIDAPDFAYQIQKHPYLNNSVTSLLKTYDEYFSGQEIRLIHLPKDIPTEKTTLETLDRIYSGDLGNTVVFI